MRLENALKKGGIENRVGLRLCNLMRRVILAYTNDSDDSTLVTSIRNCYRLFQLWRKQETDREDEELHRLIKSYNLESFDKDDTQDSDGEAEIMIEGAQEGSDAANDDNIEDGRHDQERTSAQSTLHVQPAAPADGANSANPQAEIAAAAPSLSSPPPTSPIMNVEPQPSSPSMDALAAVATAERAEPRSSPSGAAGRPRPSAAVQRPLPPPSNHGPPIATSLSASTSRNPTPPVVIPSTNNPFGLQQPPPTINRDTAHLRSFEPQPPSSVAPILPALSPDLELIPMFQHVRQNVSNIEKAYLLLQQRLSDSLGEMARLTAQNEKLQGAADDFLAEKEMRLMLERQVATLQAKLKEKDDFLNDIAKFAISRSKETH